MSAEPAGGASSAALSIIAPPTEMLAELACCITSFFNETGHQKIQRNGAWCEECAGGVILVWEPGDPS